MDSNPKTVRIGDFWRKYWGLLRMGYAELAQNGWGAFLFSVRRHIKKRKGTFPVIYPTANDYTKGLVTIGILSKDRLDLIRPCVESVESNLGEKYKVEIVIGDTGSREKEVWDFYAEAKKKWSNIKVVKIGRYFFSKNYNHLAKKHAKGEYLIFLNNDTIAKGDWIDKLIDPLRDKKIGIVGAKLLYKNETIQHAGMEFNGANALAVFAKDDKDLPEANRKAYVPVVTFACAATRHDVFERFELSEDFREECQDTDFCLRLVESGFRVLYNPECEIYHLECSSRDWRKGEADRQFLKKKWGAKITEIFEKGNQRVEFDPDEHKDSIAVIRDDGIGDLLMGVSAFKKLREKYPDKKLILATYERNIEMMAGFGIFDEFISIPNGQKYAPLPVPGDSRVCNLIDLEMKFTPFRGTSEETNKTNRHLAFSRKLGLDVGFELVPMPDYPQARKNVEQILKKEGLSDLSGQKFVVLNLISANPARSWWEPYYPVLIKAVEDMGFVPIVTGTKESPHFKGRKLVNLVGKTKTVAEYIEAVKLGKYAISTDTSASHIAALSDIPFLAIFTGGVRPEARLGFYSKYEVLEPPASFECYPCWDEGCRDLSLRGKEPCRRLITPETAVEKFKNLVERYP